MCGTGGASTRSPGTRGRYPPASSATPPMSAYRDPSIGHARYALCSVECNGLCAVFCIIICVDNVFVYIYLIYITHCAYRYGT